MLRRALPIAALFLAWPASARADGLSADTPAGKLSLGGYVEVSYSYNAGNPDNGITAYRGFDNRHNTFLISNVALDGQWEKSFASARITLQAGQTPDTYYLAEPSVQGASSVPPSGAPLWKYIQQAYVAAKAPVGLGLTFQLGVFLSPIGIEGMAVKDNWNWSRSNLFFGLPFYHTGLRATQKLTDAISITAAVYNGWNSVVDGNPGKSVSVQLLYDTDKADVSVLYFGGPERLKGAPEGQPWRHLFDVWAQASPHERVWLAAHADAGFERNVFGTSWWAAGAVYGQVKVVKWLYLAARGDYFYERAAKNALGEASKIFWPGSWVASGTGTVDARPIDGISIRLEYRHDQAAAQMFYRGASKSPNTRSQDTVTLGGAAWF